MSHLSFGGLLRGRLSTQHKILYLRARGTGIQKSTEQSVGVTSAAHHAPRWREIQRRRSDPQLSRTCSPCSSARLQSVRHTSASLGPHRLQPQRGWHRVANGSSEVMPSDLPATMARWPHTRSKSSSQAPDGGLGRLVGSVWAVRNATSKQRSASRLKLKAKFQAPRSCCIREHHVHVRSATTRWETRASLRSRDPSQNSARKAAAPFGS